MNRHGISQNPTAEEVASLRRLWRADDAERRANVARSREQALIDENRRLVEERDRLLDLAAKLQAAFPEPPV